MSNQIKISSSEDNISAIYNSANLPIFVVSNNTIVCEISQNPSVDIDTIVCDVMIPVSKQYPSSIISIEFPAQNNENWIIRMQNGEPFFDENLENIVYAEQ